MSVSGRARRELPLSGAAGSGAFKGWSACANAMKEYDKEIVQGWKEEVDTLLVFAGLFSAVLTAFVIESYALLQPDPQDSTDALLQQISFQMHASSSSNTSALTVTLPNFQPAASSVRINAFWFSSLVFSLASALTGIFIKQWLREYTNTGVAAPRDLVRLRHFRYEGLVAWRVPEIVATLPLLLQTALVLFFAGLIDLLWSLHTLVAAIVTAIIALFLLLAFSSVLLPFFSASCPFKSPLSWAARAFILRLVATSLAHLGSVFPDVELATGYRFTVSDSWREHDLQLALAQAENQATQPAASIDFKALLWAHKTFRDDDLLDVLLPCTGELDRSVKLHFVFSVLAWATKPKLSPSALLTETRSGAGQAFKAFKLAQGRQSMERCIQMILDALPSAEWAGEIDRADLLRVLQPLLNGYIIYGKDGSINLPLVARTYKELMATAGPSTPDPPRKVALELLRSFGHIFQNNHSVDDSIHLLQYASSAFPGNAARLYDQGEVFVLASATALRYVRTLPNEAQGLSSVKSCVEQLVYDMELHVISRNKQGRPYVVENVTTPLWSLELLGLARTGLVPRDLLAALEESNRLNLLPALEKQLLANIKEDIDNIVFLHPPSPPFRRPLPRPPPIAGPFLSPVLSGDDPSTRRSVSFSSTVPGSPHPSRGSPRPSSLDAASSSQALSSRDTATPTHATGAPLVQHTPDDVRQDDGFERSAAREGEIDLIADDQEQRPIPPHVESHSPTPQLAVNVSTPGTAVGDTVPTRVPKSVTAAYRGSGTRRTRIIGGPRSRPRSPPPVR